MRGKFAQKESLELNEKSSDLKSNLVAMLKRRDTTAAEGVVQSTD